MQLFNKAAATPRGDIWSPHAPQLPLPSDMKEAEGGKKTTYKLACVCKGFPITTDKTFTLPGGCKNTGYPVMSMSVRYVGRAYVWI